MATCPECRKQFPDEVQDCPEHGLALVPDAFFEQEDEALAPGTPVGDYEVEALLGEGTFGRVYRAVHPVIGRRVAIKVLNRLLSSDARTVSRFISEARALVQLDSPHIVDIFSFGVLDDGRQYYVMEYLKGEGLEAYVKGHGALPPPAALRILAGMAHALDAAHSAGVVHRDLKPENVIIATGRMGEPVPKLLDFGIAKLVGAGQTGHRTTAGSILGTPAYMAPEQALGLEVDHRADIYAFGVVAFELLSGRLPFDADSFLELVNKHAHEPPPLLSTVAPEHEDAFDEAIAHMLQKDPADRPQTMAEALTELQDAVRATGDEKSLSGVMCPPPPIPSEAPLSERVATWDGETLPKPAAVGRAEPRTEPARSTAGDAPPQVAAATRGTAGRWTVVLGTALVAVVAAFLIGRSLTTTDDATAAPVSSATAAAPEPVASPPRAAAAEPSEPKPKTIQLTVETSAPGAHVFLDGVDLGAAPGPVPIPYGQEPVDIEVRAAGHETARLSLRPDQDRTEPAVLRPLPGARPAPPPRTSVAPSASTPGELAIPAFMRDGGAEP